MVTVKVGDKGVLPYALAAMEHFRAGEDVIEFVARGNVINNAVNAANMVATILSHASITHTLVTTEEVRDGGQVSVIRITLKRDNGSETKP